jgi:enhancing lycopene biosynthesis protein 2
MGNKGKIAVILGGCGNRDGSEIHEATMTLLAIVRNGFTYEVFAPDKPQHHVINHYTGEVAKETRNCLAEAARIARGKIKPVTSFNAQEYDALILPGGSGIAKNLCDFALTKEDFTVISEVSDAITSMHKQNKPIGALCIAPVIVGRVLGNVEVTFGQDNEAANRLKKYGTHHKQTNTGEIVIDVKNKIVSCPCYMLNANISEVADEAEKLVKAVIQLMK